MQAADPISSHAPQGAAALALLINAVEKLAGASREAEVADIVRTAARKLTGADGVCVVMLDGDRVRYVAEDAVSPLWAGQDFPIDACISGWAIMNRQTVVIDDIRGDPRIPLAAYEPTFVKSLAMAPVRPSAPIAAIGAYWATLRRPTDDEVHALETIARATAVALENVRLRRGFERAAEEAQTADEAKSAFLANMSHEIRTPLNGVVALVDMLAATPLSSQQREMTQLISSSADQLMRVVTDILDFAKIDAGKPDLVIAPFELERAVRMAAEPFAPRAAEKGVGFEVKIASEAQDVFRGDEMRIKQIVANLVSNAVKFTDSGAISVRVAEDARVGPVAMMLIEVKDSGIGFDDTVRGTMFERFTQADTSITRRYGGTGLGMAIVDALVRAMRGSIEAASQPGEGATFTVRLPLELEPDAVEEEDIVVLDDLDPDRPPSHLRILCAEDHPTNQAVIRMSLAPLGAEIKMVENGEQAVRAFMAAPPDVILMDMQMPVLDGLEATRRIRAYERDSGAPHVPIVMVTAHAMRQHVTAAFLAGVDSFVPKPATPVQLMEAVRAALDAQANAAA